MANYEIAHFTEIPSQRCPCGFTQRAFAESGNVASMHVVDIQEDSRTHYHKRMTEIYFARRGGSPVCCVRMRPFLGAEVEFLRRGLA